MFVDVTRDCYQASLRENALRAAQEEAKQLGAMYYYGEYIGPLDKATLSRKRITNMGLKNKKVTKSYEEQFDKLIAKYSNYDTEVFGWRRVPYSFENYNEEPISNKPTFKDKLLLFLLILMLLSLFCLV